jgi:hypothetical protein
MKILSVHYKYQQANATWKSSVCSVGVHLNRQRDLKKCGVIVMLKEVVHMVTAVLYRAK